MISIIGSGRVGSAIAFLCAHSALDDIMLVNRDEKKAIGVAMDISNAIPGNATISVNGTGDISKTKGSDLIVITASVGIHLENRAELLFDQATLMNQISKDLLKYAPESKILVVTNPVDAMTFLVQKNGFPSNHVMGVASNLDSDRFRYFLAREFVTNQSKITGALVIGEHDDTMVPVFSNAKFNGKPVNDFLDERKKLEITRKVRDYWRYFRKYGVHSIFGIAKNTFEIINAMKRNESYLVPVSVLLQGQYGISGVCIGVPAKINGNGLDEIIELELDESETKALFSSANSVRNNAMSALEFLGPS